MSTSGPVRVDGEHYQVHGAKRGPAPAHQVGIWIGAYKPRMLELTGRLGDGWLPSAAYLEAGALRAGNAAIDLAAQDSDRAPRDVRRLLNISGAFRAISQGFLQGPAGQWADELADLALTEGVSAFILATDDPDDLRRYAEEVVPAVREAVAAERAPAGSGQAVPPTSPPPLRVAVPGALAVTPTPPPTSPHSAVTLWDEATRPEGPTPDPNGVYTAAGQAGAQHLVDVHDDLRREMAQVLRLAGQVADGTATAQAARGAVNSMAVGRSREEFGGLCRAHCGIVATHHSIEDRAVFPQLRGADPRLGAVLDRLGEEHEVIHDVLDRVDLALVAFVADPGAAADLRDTVDLLSDALLSHLSYEERELIEPLARLGG